jgi:hypothetical protein
MNLRLKTRIASAGQIYRGPVALEVSFGAVDNKTIARV